MKMLPLFSLLSLFPILTSCAPYQAYPVNPNTNAWIAKAVAEKQKGQVNENWNVRCDTGHVSAVRRCSASAEGKMMDLNGNAVAPINIGGNIYEPSGGGLSVEFYDNYGPLINVGHNYPGRKPIIRIDENKPLTISDDGGVTDHKPDPAIVQQMRKGAVARIQYDKWPKGTQTMIVKINGFDQAWERLNQLRKEKNK